VRGPFRAGHQLRVVLVHVTDARTGTASRTARRLPSCVASRTAPRERPGWCRPGGGDLPDASGYPFRLAHTRRSPAGLGRQRRAHRADRRRDLGPAADASAVDPGRPAARNRLRRPRHHALAVHQARSLAGHLGRTHSGGGQPAARRAHRLPGRYPASGPPRPRRGPARGPADAGADDHHLGEAAGLRARAAAGAGAARQPGRPPHPARVGSRGSGQRPDAGPGLRGGDRCPVRALAYPAPAGGRAALASRGRAGQPGRGPRRLRHPERVRRRVPARNRPDACRLLPFPPGLTQAAARDGYPSRSPVYRATNDSVSPASSADRLTARAP
jgi:hypothetical protein